MSSSAEELAKDYESGEAGMDRGAGGGSKGGKRSKAEQVEHKHPHPEGATRKQVDNWMHGEDKRREHEQQRASSKEREAAAK